MRLFPSVSVCKNVNPNRDPCFGTVKSACSQSFVLTKKLAGDTIDKGGSEFVLLVALMLVFLLRS